jgi:hypothetical protein
MGSSMLATPEVRRNNYIDIRYPSQELRRASDELMSCTSRVVDALSDQLACRNSS